jgi:hypothetical protein
MGPQHLAKVKAKNPYCRFHHGGTLEPLMTRPDSSRDHDKSPAVPFSLILHDSPTELAGVLLQTPEQPRWNAASVNPPDTNVMRNPSP